MCACFVVVLCKFLLGADKVVPGKRYKTVVVRRRG